MSGQRKKFRRELKRKSVKLATRCDNNLPQVERNLDVSINVMSLLKRQLTDDSAFGQGPLKEIISKTICNSLKKQI